MTKRTSAKQSARQRAAEVRAARQQHEKKVMQALTEAFEAVEARDKAEEGLSRAVGDLIDLGESRSSIAESLGITTADVKRLSVTPGKQLTTDGGVQNHGGTTNPGA